MYVTVPLDVLEDKTVHMYTTLPICTLLEKISEKFKFQWIFVEGVGCKLHIIDISITYDFSLLPIKEYLLKYQFYPFYLQYYCIDFSMRRTNDKILPWGKFRYWFHFSPVFFFGRFFVKKILYNVYTRRWCLLSKPKILISFVVPWACPGGSVSPLLGFFNTVSTIHRADTNSWMVTHLSDNRVVKGALLYSSILMKTGVSNFV